MASHPHTCKQEKIKESLFTHYMSFLRQLTAPNTSTLLITAHGGRVDKTAAKTSSTLDFLSRHFINCTKEVKERTYNTFVLPTLEYASSVWNPYLNSDINKLERPVKRSALCPKQPGCVINPCPAEPGYTLPLQTV